MCARISVSSGVFRMSQDDAAAAKRRREIAERLIRGDSVPVNNAGQIVTDEAAKTERGGVIEVPQGKLAAGFYWYERNPSLYALERQAMSERFPRFQLEKLDDQRLCWIGTLNPLGSAGGGWTVQAVYDHNHPHNNSYGGSVRVYSIKPTLEDLYETLGDLPHVLRDSNGSLYMCTARPEDVHSGHNAVTSAASSLANAVKWIAAVECWLRDLIPGHKMGVHDRNGI
jgi:hypothetical protein